MSILNSRVFQSFRNYPFAHEYMNKRRLSTPAFSTYKDQDLYMSRLSGLRAVIITLISMYSYAKGVIAVLLGSVVKQ